MIAQMHDKSRLKSCEWRTGAKSMGQTVGRRRKKYRPFGYRFCAVGYDFFTQGETNLTHFRSKHFWVILQKQRRQTLAVNYYFLLLA
jgi:hypothetical protein